MFINTHTHAQIYDATIEVVNLEINAMDRPNYYSFGIHPWYIEKSVVHEQLSILERKVSEKYCLAIGECGLDKLSKVDFDLQEEVFKAQVIIANRVKKPLIVHCVKSFNELLNCLNECDNEVPVVIHGFNNNENIARVLRDNGCYFSFGKALLGFDSNAAKAIRSVGRKHLFLETDDADVSIKYIYGKAADLLGVDEEILKEQVLNNFQTVFKLNE